MSLRPRVGAGRLIASDDDSVDSLIRRARRAAFAGDADTAIPLYVQAIAKGCTVAGAFNDLGVLLAQKGQLPPAVVQFEIAVALEPHASDVRDNLCKALDGLGLDAFAEQRWTDAAVAYTRYAALDVMSASAHTNAGMAWRAAGALDRALPFLRRAAELTPAEAVAHFNLGTVLLELNQRACELELLQSSAIDPRHADTQVNLGLTYYRLGQLTKATSYLDTALRLVPEHVDAHVNLGAVLREQGDIVGSLAHYRRALELRPDQSRIFSDYLLSRQADPTVGPAQMLAEHRSWNARFADPVDPGPRGGYIAPLDRTPDRRLRIGYVSPDFRNHAVATFIEPIIAAHDRERVRITCYSDAVPDEVTRRIQTLTPVEVWRDVRALDHQALARRIADDGIDILVDLSGHTANNRLLTFARRPAPVQVTYCGYPGSTGLSAIGWRLTDDVTDPFPSAEAYHSESLWRLPNGFLCFQPNPDFGIPAPAPCLTQGFVTFGSFNNLSKVGEAVLETWAEILRRLPNAQLLLKSRALSDLEPRERLRQVLGGHGIESERIRFAPYAANSVEHAALYAQMDIALDPFPYTGTTTTCEALWMGVPVVTLMGETHRERVGASLLTHIGRGDLVAANRAAYVDTALRLAREPDRLAAGRVDLRAKMAASPLTNAAVIAQDIEIAYREMWRRACSSADAAASQP